MTTAPRRVVVSMIHRELPAQVVQTEHFVTRPPEVDPRLCGYVTPVALQFRTDGRAFGDGSRKLTHAEDLARGMAARWTGFGDLPPVPAASSSRTPKRKRSSAPEGPAAEVPQSDLFRGTSKVGER